MAINIYNDFNLKKYNSFALDVVCKKFIEYTDKEDIINFVKNNLDIFNEKFFILGNGTNILFSEKYFDGIIIHQKEKKITSIDEINYENRGDNYFFTVDASVNLDSLIDITSDLGYSLVNLSGIPGAVAAGVVQNCGAYGAEISESFFSLRAINLHTGEISEIRKKDCNFEYRNSVFKNNYANKLLILDVSFSIPDTKNYLPHFNNRELYNNFTNNQEYINLIDNLEKTSSENSLAIKRKLLKMIRNFILETRAKKIPDYKILGNAGSFFKNPVVNKDLLEKILTKYPETKFFENGNNFYKLAAGWLIDKTGLKGYKHKSAAVSDINALIITNLNNSTGKEIIELSEIIKEKVFEKFAVSLEPEVIFI